MNDRLATLAITASYVLAIFILLLDIFVWRV